MLFRSQLRSGGFRPNKLTLARPVADVLFDHPSVISRLPTGTADQPVTANERTLAAILGLDEVLIMDGIVNAAKEGLAESNQFFGGKSALLTYSPAAPTLMTPSAGYTFNWTGLVGSGNDGMRIKRFYIDALASDRIEIDMSYDQKLVAKDMGYFFGAIVA